MVDKMGGESNSPRCLSCAKLQEAVEASKKEHALTLKMVKEKIISTDELIKKYQQKCLECDKHLQQVTESTSKLEAAQMKVDNLQSQLEKCQQSAEPLRKNVTRLHRENTLAESTISELREKLQKTEKMYSEMVSIAKVKEQKECAWRLEQQVQAQELQKLKNSVDKGGTNFAKLQEQLKKEKEQNKELNRSLAAANRKVSKQEQQLQQAKLDISSLKIDVDLAKTRRSIELETIPKARKQRRSRQSGEQFAERIRASNPESSPSRNRRVEHVLLEVRESVELALSPLPPSPDAHSEVDSSGSEPEEMTDAEDSSDNDEAPSGKSDSDSSLGDLADIIFGGDNDVIESTEEQPLNSNGAEFNENLEDNANVDAFFPEEEKANLEQENKKSTNSTVSPKEKVDLKEGLGDTESELFSEDMNSDQLCSVSQSPQDISAVNRTRHGAATCTPRENIPNPLKERQHVTEPKRPVHMTRSRSKATENCSSVESDRLLDQKAGSESEPDEAERLDNSLPKQTDFKETPNAENEKGLICINSKDRINTSPVIVPDTQQAVTVSSSQILDISFDEQTVTEKEATDDLAKQEMTSDALGAPYVAENSARLDSVCGQSVSDPAMSLTEKNGLSMSSEDKPLVAASEEMSVGGHDSETLFASKTRIEESSSEKTREARELSSAEHDNARSCEKETLEATPKEVVSFNNENKSFAPDEKVKCIEDNFPRSQHEVKTQIEKTSLEENNSNVVKDSEYITKHLEVGVDSVMTLATRSELSTETKLALDLGSSETSKCSGERTVVTSALHNIEEKGIKPQIAERLETHDDVELSTGSISSAIKIAIKTIETSSITGADMSRGNCEDNAATQVSLKCDEIENVHSAALSSFEDGSLHKSEHVSASANTMTNSDGVSVSFPEESDVTLSQSEKAERDIHNVETTSGQISCESHTSSPDEKIKSESFELTEGTAGEDMVGCTDEVSTAEHSDVEIELSINKTDSSDKVGSVSEVKEQEFMFTIHENKGKQQDVIYSTRECDLPSSTVHQSVFKDSLFHSNPTCKNDVCLSRSEYVDEIKEVDSNACCNELKETSRAPLARKQKSISHNITNSTTQEQLISVSESHSVASDTILLSSCSEDVHLLVTSVDENTESLKVDVALGELKDSLDNRMDANSFDTTKPTQHASLNTGLFYNSNPILSRRKTKAPICREKTSEDADRTCLKVCHTSLTRNPNDDQSLLPGKIDSPVECILDSLVDFCADFPPLSPLPPSPTRCDEDLGSDLPLPTCGWLQEQPNADNPAAFKDTSGNRGNCRLNQTKEKSSKASDGVTTCKAIKRKIVGDSLEVRSLKASKMESPGQGSSSTADRGVGKCAAQKNLTSIRDLRKSACQSGGKSNNRPQTKTEATPCENSVKKSESSKLSMDSNAANFKALVQKGAIEKRLKHQNSVEKNENFKFPVKSNPTNSKAPVEKCAMEKRPKKAVNAESLSDGKATTVEGDLKGKYRFLSVRPAYMPEVKYVLRCLARVDEDNVDLDAVIGRFSSKRCISSTTPVASAIVQFLKQRREEDITTKILHQLESNRMEWQPMLTDFEGRLVNLVCGLSEHALFQNFTPQLVTLCCRCLISSCRGCNKEELKGLLSLSRMLTALCKLKEDLGCVRVVCYDLIRSLYDLPEIAVELVVAVIAVWPEVLQSPFKGYRPLLSTIKTVLLSFVHKSSLTDHCNIFRKLCVWEDEQYVLNALTDLGSVLVEWLKTQLVRVLMRGEGGILALDGVCFGVVKSLELLSCVLGWKWTLNTLIINNIWKIMKTWASEETNNSRNYSSTAVTDTIVSSEPDINSSQKRSEVRLNNEGNHNNFNINNKSSVCCCQSGAWTRLSNFENSREKTKGFSVAHLQNESKPGNSSCTDRIGGEAGRQRVMEQSGEMLQFCSMCGNPRGSVLAETRVVLCIQLLGSLCRIAVENCQSSVPEIVDMLCGLMEQSSVTTKVTYHVQLAAAMSLLDMSPWQPERVAATIKKWLAALKTSKSSQAPTCVTQGLVCLESILKSNRT